MITLDSVLLQQPDQCAAELDGEVLMLHVDSGNYYGYNEVGSFIWNRLAQPRTVRALCDAIEAAFAVSRAQCEADTLAYLAELVNDGTLLVVDPTSGRAEALSR